MKTTTERMTTAEINKHPAIVPFLVAWRAARAKRDQIVMDARFGVGSEIRAEREAAETGRAYDEAVARLIGVVPRGG